MWSAHTVRSSDGTVIAFRSFGTGEPVIVVGGAMRTASDYVRFGAELGRQFEVHVLERRGRGASGPLGPTYSIASECADVLAVGNATGASLAFGHSYGGLVLLDAAARGAPFTHLALYEPAVSVAGSIPTGWLDEYRRRLAAGDPRGAFASFVKGSGHAPAAMAELPTWYVRGVLTVALRTRWHTMAPLLEANAREHEQVARLDGSIERYATIESGVSLLYGSRSPRAQTSTLLDLHRLLPASTVEMMEGLDHNAPDEKAPAVVADRVARLLAGADEPRPLGRW